MNEGMLIVREEREADFDAIRQVVMEAFASAEHSDGDEYALVERLRQTDDYIPALSLVAEWGGEVVGHIMFSRISIGNTEAIALAPLAVLPSFQDRGIGKELIMAAHQRAQELGYCCSVVLGSPGYYSRYGYVPASIYGITSPFDVPSEFYMVCPFHLPVPVGMVTYSDAFGLH